MSAENKILLSENPRGRFEECIISGTPVPGTVMQVVAATEPVENTFTYQAYNKVIDGNRAPIAVLLVNKDEGFIKTSAFVSGTRGLLYYPLPGDYMNMLVLDISGTAESFAIGDPLVVDDGTGKLIASIGTGGQGVEAEPFECRETVTGPAADHHMKCIFTGY